MSTDGTGPGKMRGTAGRPPSPQPATATAPGYGQIAADLHGQIHSGRLAQGARLPSMRELQKWYTVSALTARSALNLLRTQGLAHTVPGRGTFVASPSPSTTEEDEGRRREQLEETLREVLGHLRPQGHPGWELNTCLVSDEQLARWWAVLGATLPAGPPQHGQ